METGLEGSLKMKRIDQAEINYIFSYMQEKESEYYSKQPVYPAQSIINALTRNPVLALTCAWKYAARTGLTPFTLHYLTDSKDSLGDFMKKYFTKKYIFYNYCYATRLPVACTRIYKGWDFPVTVHLDPPGRWGDNKENSDQRDLRFNELSVILAKDTTDGIVDDEYMRCFGHMPIPRSIWDYLKNVAGIYK